MADEGRDDLGPVANAAGIALHVALIGVAGVATLGWCIVKGTGVPIAHSAAYPGLWIAVFLVVIGEVRPILSRRESDGTTMSTAFASALLLVVGWPVAALTQACGSIFAGVARRHVWWRTTFNASQHALSYAAAGGVLAAAGIHPSYRDPWMPDGRHLPAIVLAYLVYFAVNHFLVWSAVALASGQSLVALARRDLVYQLVVTGTMLSLGPLIAIILLTRAWLLPLFGPVLIAVYRSANISKVRERQSLHDPLTGLANRDLLQRNSEAALEVAARTGQKIGLILLDLDRFKEVNDTLGHLTGDELLCHVAARLTGAVRDGDTVARLGGDEFAVLLAGIPGVEVARELADRVAGVFAEPFELRGRGVAAATHIVGNAITGAGITGPIVLDLEASIGIAVHPDHAGDYEALLARADVAMYMAKRSRSGIATYDAVSDVNTPDRLGLLGDLRRALAAGEVEVHYQPKVSFTDREPVGFEALVRWNHPERGMIPPELFVDLAEQSGLMPRLTEFVVDSALTQVAKWRRSGYSVPVAVNVSMRDVHGPDFVRMIADKLLRHAVPPAALKLEITERVLLQDPVRAAATLAGLDALGVRLSMDDFGTGYSSLVHLRRIPVSEIKIDRSFIARLVDDPEDAVIVRSTVELAHALGLHVVAEGVEDEATWDRLAALGCDAAQGWLLSPALNPDEATLWIKSRRGGAVSAR